MDTRKTTKQSGGPEPWTTEEQREYLLTQCKAYMASKSKESFWANVFEHWFQHWPISDRVVGQDGSEAVGDGSISGRPEKSTGKALTETD